MELKFLPKEPVMEVKFTQEFVKGILAGTINLLETPNITIGVEIGIEDIQCPHSVSEPITTIQLRYKMSDKKGTPIVISAPVTSTLGKGDVLNLFNLESVFEVNFKQ